MATLEELQAQRQRTLAEIKRRRAAGLDPVGYESRLKTIETQIREIRSGTGGGTTPPADDGGTGGGGDTTTPPPTTNPPATTDPTGISADDRKRFEDSINMGRDFGNQLINDLGFSGDFLPRIDVGPSAQYVADLERLRGLAGTSGNLDPLEEEALANARNALSGLDSAENAALRNAAKSQIDRAASAATRQLMRYQGGLVSQGQRTAQLADLSRGRIDARRNLERDLLIENIAEKTRAREAFSNLASTTSQNRSQRQLGYNQAVISGQGNADALTSAGQQFNALQKASELSTRASTYLGGIGTTTGLLGGYAAEDFQNKALTEALAAKDKEIEEMRRLNAETLAAQERIMKTLSGRIS